MVVFTSRSSLSLSIKETTSSFKLPMQTIKDRRGSSSSTYANPDEDNGYQKEPESCDRESDTFEKKDE